MAMTPEQKKAASERMKAMHAAKKLQKEVSKNNPVVQDPPQPEIPAEPQEKFYTQQDMQAMQAQIDEVMQLLKNQQGAQAYQAPVQQGPQIANGRVIGTQIRYSVDPNSYPDPTERLSNEVKLQPFAFAYNYDVEYEFDTTEYQTKDGIWQKEPIFVLRLSRKRLEDGQDTGGRYLISTARFFEDPQSAVTVARQNGYDVNEMNQEEFLNEMRYIAMRDWLLENFYPAHAFEKRSNKQDIVLDGKVVEYFEITSQKSEAMPFDQLRSKM